LRRAPGRKRCNALYMNHPAVMTCQNPRASSQHQNLRSKP
jgi:hypothetical protein